MTKPNPNLKKPEETELSAEDQELYNNINLLVERIQDPDHGISSLAFESIKTLIKDATSTMTSVPKPLKFLRPHYSMLSERFSSLPPNKNDQSHQHLADILAVLAMTLGEAGTHEALTFKLQGSFEEIESWGHEFVRNIAGEIGVEYNRRKAENEVFKKDDLLELVDHILPFHMKHNLEPDAVDLLIECENIPRIIPYIDTNNYARVCLYLLSCSHYFPEPEHTLLLQNAHTIFVQAGNPLEAARVSLMMNDYEQIARIITAETEKSTLRQIAFMLSRSPNFSIDSLPLSNDSEKELLSEILSNSKLSEYYLNLQADLEIGDPKDPEDIFKQGSTTNNKTTHGGSGRAYVDSARHNLTASFVNAFVNAASGKDSLMLEDGNAWVHKNKDQGMMVATASLGLILLWNVEEGLSQIDKYMYAVEPHFKAGALLAIGILNTNVRNECDPALALLQEHITSTQGPIAIGSIFGLGIAYAGTRREDLLGLLTPLVESCTVSIEVQAIAALALGLIFTGSGNADATQAIIAVMIEFDEKTLDSSYIRFFCLAIGFIWMQLGDKVEVALEMLNVIQGPVGKYSRVTVETCAYACSGNVLQVQKLLHILGTRADVSEQEEKTGLGAQYQAVAVLGIALIVIGDDLGSEMSTRTFEHLLQYGEPILRRSVPLALGLLYICHPDMHVMDTLSKLSHDSDSDVAKAAILGLGFIGAATNNSRIVQILHKLSLYYQKDPSALFLVRLSQGLLQLGKGTITMSPLYLDRSVLCPHALAGLLILLHSALDFKAVLFQSYYLIYSLCVSMHPRMLMTLDENLKQISTTVRVGQAVDTVGQAGKPKTITGFQTQTTPVLLGHNDRAEFATEEYISPSPHLEGLVIVKPNPASEEKKK